MHGLADASAASASSQHFLQRVRCTQCSHMPPPPVPASRQFLHWNRRAPCSQMPPPPVPASQHVLQRDRCAPTRPCYFAEGTPHCPPPRAAVQYEDQILRHFLQMVRLTPMVAGAGGVRERRVSTTFKFKSSQ